jgi:hypothetical protein
VRGVVGQLCFLPNGNVGQTKRLSE